MSYYLEVWLRGFAKNHLRAISRQNPEFYHPHITLVRPFEIKTGEEEVRRKIVAFCNKRKPIPFSLEGREVFPEGVSYVPVVACESLLQFNDELEGLLEGNVEFAPRLGEQKVLHATVDFLDPNYVCPRMNQHMLRLTGIRNKRIWFSYDFRTQRELTREESLLD